MSFQRELPGRFAATAAYIGSQGRNLFFRSVANQITQVITNPNPASAALIVRRPNLVPRVDPYVTSGGLVFLNPAAFSVPLPGTFGDLERNSIKGPGFYQFDVVLSKRFAMGQTSNLEFRAEIFNLFNRTNFTNPVGTLPNALPSSTLTESNKIQPGQVYTAAAGGTFGTLPSTVGRTVGLGTNRQVQFAVRLSF